MHDEVPGLLVYSLSYKFYFTGIPGGSRGTNVPVGDSAVIHSPIRHFGIFVVVFLPSSTESF